MKAIEKALNRKEFALQTFPYIQKILRENPSKAVREMTDAVKGFFVSSALYPRLYRDIVLEAVKQKGLALEYADEALKQDRDIVLEAVKENGQALRYADEALKQDHFVFDAVKQNGLALFSAGRA